MSISTKRISNYISNYQTMEYVKNGFEMFATQEPYQIYEGGKIAGGDYTLSTWNNGNLVQSDSYETIEDLAIAMKKESGDLRVWKVVPYES